MKKIMENVCEHCKHYYENQYVQKKLTDNQYIFETEGKTRKCLLLNADLPAGYFIEECNKLEYTKS